jgi:hypothetical protein
MKVSDVSPLISFLKQESGYSYDTEIPEELFEKCEDALEETDRTTVTKHFPNAKSYRDSNSRVSVHLTDYRGLEREELDSDTIVAHLERFNPEHHPVLHALIDFPMWYYKNRIREKNNL